MFDNLTQNEINVIVKRMQHDPLFTIKHILGIENLTKEQEEIALSVWSNRVTAVKSSPSMGKTFIAAAICLAFLLPNKDSKVVSTAPTGRQVEDLLWSEIASLYNNCKYPIGGKLNTTDLILSDKWFATGISTTPGKEDESSVKMRGYHAPKILVIIDEASGVHPAIFEAVEDITSSEYSKVLMISNPTNPSGEFFKACKSKTTHVIKMNCFTHPNIIAKKEIIKGAISTAWVKKQIDKFCEETDHHVKEDMTFEYEGKIYKPSNMAIWRILAEFPVSAQDTLIGYAAVEAAMNRSEVIASDVFASLDVARVGNDKSVFCLEKNNRFTYKAYYHFDIAKITGEAIKFIKEHTPRKFGVDCDGIGAGVYDNLMEAQKLGTLSKNTDLVEIHGGASPIELHQTEQFLNLRAQMYWTLAQDISVKSIEKNDEILDGLSDIKYKYTREGKIQIESKEDFKKRNSRSSDYEDATIYTNFMKYDINPVFKSAFID